jgi:hypothetical protein
VESFAQIIDWMHALQPRFSSLKVEPCDTEIGIDQLDRTTEPRDIIHLSEEDILDSKLAHSVLLKLLPTTSIPYQTHTQGAVIVGGGRYTATVIFSVLMIRKQNPKLPVEIFLLNRLGVGFTGAVRHRLEGFPVFVVVMS